MTYLATEMVLYLLSAAVIGMVLGGLIWGGGKRRQLRAQRAELMARLESQKSAHEKTKLSLDNAEARSKEAVRAAIADAERALDAERRKVEVTTAELERVRNEGNASQQEALHNALRAAEAERAVAAQAQGREAQARAQIEELRLLIGAEKLAADSVRGELDSLRREMQETIESERKAHEQARTALADIRSALARTFGPDAPGLAAAVAAGAGEALPEARNGAAPPDRQSRLPLFPGSSDMAAAGDALNNPDQDEADSEDRDDLSLDLATSIDAYFEPDSDLDVDDLIDEPEDRHERASASESVPGPESAPRRIGLVRPAAGEAVAAERPALLLDQRPDAVDDLTAIDGIGEEIASRLNAQGCYHYRQLAALTPADIDWLAPAIDVTPYRIAVDRWVQQAKRLEGETHGAGESAPAVIDRASRENAAG